MKKTLLVAALVIIAAIEQGCFHSSHEGDIKPVEIKPMHVTIDLNVKVEKRLAEFFDEIDKKAEEISSSKKKTSKTPLTVPSTPATSQISTSTSTQTNDKN